ncbi:MAG: UDP-N-acetylglucosamine pyrophosphorylase [Planctomyces sp.]|nr:UDP-N-acetylglucosamine pyrophosphorylase [Planctomyces sp.]
MSASADLKQRLESANQQHLLKWWDDLSREQQANFEEQLTSVDFDLIRRLLEKGSGGAGESIAAKAERATPPKNLVRLADLTADPDLAIDADKKGRELLAAGKVGVVLVAGGQGTRLGFDQPKGMFPIGPVTDRTLFQIMFEQVLARSKKSGVKIPYLIMTSDATDADTRSYLKSENYFGLDESDVLFFKQGTMPAVDDREGTLLLADKGQLSVSPDGHGGMLGALANANLFQELESRGIEYLYYHQVDNPTAIIADPVFLGLHVLRESEMSTKVIAKVNAGEKTGVVVDVDGETQIIEYSDMPTAVSEKTDSDGDLLHWAGSTAIHVFDVQFLKRIAESADGLPFHTAHKKVSHLAENGELIVPDEPNAYKFERFIFDALPMAKNALVMEADRSKEFNPVKNAEGSDSPQTCRSALNLIAVDWLTMAGAEVESGTRIEISPLYAVEPADLDEKIEPGTHYSGEVILK